jgi:hypothetical protein
MNALTNEDGLLTMDSNMQRRSQYFRQFGVNPY